MPLFTGIHLNWQASYNTVIDLQGDITNTDHHGRPDDYLK